MGKFNHFVNDSKFVGRIVFRFVVFFLYSNMDKSPLGAMSYDTFLSIYPCFGAYIFLARIYRDGNSWLIPCSMCSNRTSTPNLREMCSARCWAE